MYSPTNLPESISQKLFLRDVEAASLVGYAVQTLRNWRHNGQGPPYVKVGRGVRYSVQELLDYFSKNTIRPNGGEVG